MSLYDVADTLFEEIDKASAAPRTSVSAPSPGGGAIGTRAVENVAEAPPTLTLLDDCLQSLKQTRELWRKDSGTALGEATKDVPNPGTRWRQIAAHDSRQLSHLPASLRPRLLGDSDAWGDPLDHKGRPVRTVSEFHEEGALHIPPPPVPRGAVEGRGPAQEEEAGHGPGPTGAAQDGRAGPKGRGVVRFGPAAGGGRGGGHGGGIGAGGDGGGRASGGRGGDRGSGGGSGGSGGGGGGGGGGGAGAGAGRMGAGRGGKKGTGGGRGGGDGSGPPPVDRSIRGLPVLFDHNRTDPTVVTLDRANADVVAAKAFQDYEREVRRWMSMGGVDKPGHTLAEFAHYLSDKYLCGMLDPLPASTVVHKVRKELASRIEAIARRADGGGDQGGSSGSSGGGGNGGTGARGGRRGSSRDADSPSLFGTTGRPKEVSSLGSFPQELAEAGNYTPGLFGATVEREIGAARENNGGGGGAGAGGAGGGAGGWAGGRDREGGGPGGGVSTENFTTPERPPQSAALSCATIPESDDDDDSGRAGDDDDDDEPWSPRGEPGRAGGLLYEPGKPMGYAGGPHESLSFTVAARGDGESPGGGGGPGTVVLERHEPLWQCAVCSKQNRDTVACAVCGRPKGHPAPGAEEKQRRLAREVGAVDKGKAYDFAAFSKMKKQLDKDTSARLQLTGDIRSLITAIRKGSGTLAL